MVELPPADTRVTPFVAMGVSTTSKHSALIEHTMVMVEASLFDYTTSTVQTMVLAQIRVEAAML